MNIVEMRLIMQSLLAAQEELMDLPVEVEVDEIVKAIDELIISTALQMANTYKVKAKKAEKPCNCPPKSKVLTQEEARKCFHTVIDVVLNKIGEEERK